MEKTLATDLGLYFEQLASTFESEVFKRVQLIHSRCDALDARLQFAELVFPLILDRLRGRVNVQTKVSAERQLEVLMSARQITQLASERVAIRRTQVQSEARAIQEQAMCADAASAQQRAEVYEKQEHLQCLQQQTAGTSQLIAEQRNGSAACMQEMQACVSKREHTEQQLADVRRLREMQQSQVQANTCDMNELMQRRKTLQLENKSLKCQIERLLELINECAQNQSDYGLNIISMTIDQFATGEGRKVGVIRQELVQKREQELRIRQLRKQLQGAVEQTESYERLIAESTGK